MNPTRVAHDMAELTALRGAVKQAAEYQPGKVTVRVDFAQPIASYSVKMALYAAAGEVVKNVLPTAEMRLRIEEVLKAKIATIEARYPAGVVDGG